MSLTAIAAERNAMSKIESARTPNYVQQLLIQRKYGMFLHFGINTFNDTEWSDGTLPVSSYAPTGIHADQWVRTARDAGMRYVILITKHHDGFCLWDSKYTDYSVAVSGNKTDVVRAVAEACEKYGLCLGIYYSLWDRHEPCYPDDEAYTEYMKNQLTELLDGRYGKVAELWLDGGWEKRPDRWHLQELYDHVKKMQPDCAFGVNNTVGCYDLAGFPEGRFLPENCVEGDPLRYFPSDFRTADPFFPKPGADGDVKLYTWEGETYYLPFEATICVRNMRNWFWDPAYTREPTVTPGFIEEKYRQLEEQQNSLVVNCAPNTDGYLEEYDRQTIFEAARLLGIAQGEAALAR